MKKAILFITFCFVAATAVNAQKWREWTDEQLDDIDKVRAG